MIRPWICLAGLALVAGYRVDIKDTDQVREVCSGMYGGKDAHIDVRSGLCSKSDLGSFITTLPQGKQLEDTSIFTSGLRFASGTDSGSNIPAWDEEEEEAPVYDKETSVSTSSTSTKTGTRTAKATATATAVVSDPYDDKQLPEDIEEQLEEALEEELEEEIIEEMIEAEMEAELEAELEDEEDAFASFEDHRRQVKRGTRTLPPLRIGYAAAASQRQQQQQRKRQIVDDLGLEDLGMFGSDGEEDAQEEALEEMLEELEDEGAGYSDDTFDESFEDTYEQEENASPTSSSRKATSTSGAKRPSSGLGGGNNVDGISAGSGASVPVYNGAITYAVPKTGYYCVGVVPVTLVNSRKRSSLPAASALARRQAEHAQYAGSVVFRNTFKGELPAAEYPKIGFYGLLSVLYVVGAIAWGWLCFQNRSELLPMQVRIKHMPLLEYYISGTIGFLVVEMIANFAYYRYINKHGGGSGSMAFLFVVAILNAARNSLSFFLLLIVSMGLSVVTPSLGSIMNRIRLLTAMHFIFGVIYAIGTVRIEIESASLFLVLFMIFPLALTLTAFLMWTIISLNGTITHLAARKQRHKLQMFKRLYRILMLSVIAVAAFFVISSLSLSNRLEEDYAPRNWKYRWILLDASLALIYLAAFGAVAYLWRPSRDNIRFAMSQELAQDEHDADDYEFGNLENRPVHHDQDYDDMDDEERGFISNENGQQDGYKSENVVFALEDEDSDEEHHHRPGQFQDEEAAETAGDVGRTRDDKGKLD
ncbi:hypothetical protein QFC22_005166 [Naganishia vaughanmartiniae]|uniref:Uncharacterized protein n=1 Tax=Naganishia vaughanmartiniae TaxID=1424756 RepID=A0ACC2WW98_9TREE|nr:hypothetical protein QFC22_005166 [Naganishia vaughanmartiniae]